MSISKKSKLIIISILLINIIIIAVTVFIFLIQNHSSSTFNKNDYEKAFNFSILFYDANKCGKDVAIDNIFEWRGPCHVNDGYDVNLDLTGGFHDGSEHMKVGLTQGFSASILGWSLFKNRNVFDSTNNTSKMLSTLKYFTDYFLKCHVNESTFYYNIGDVIEDQLYLGPPEKQSNKRPTKSIADSTHAASDVCGETSASLSLMYLNYKSIDSSYANKCLVAAKELYEMGRNNVGYADNQSYYVSGNFYDDLAWAALWLYKIELDGQYLKDAEEFVLKKNKYDVNPMTNEWTLCWDDVTLACFLELYTITEKQVYKDALNYNLSYWINQLKKTRGGLRYLDANGVLRYAASECLIAMQWYQIINDNSLKTFAKSQIDYILGENPVKTSYIVGFGSNFPKNVNHRAANGLDPDETKMSIRNKHVLLGALIGGPSEEDEFVDNPQQYQYSGVAIDFNAGLVGALASIIHSMED